MRRFSSSIWHSWLRIPAGHIYRLSRNHTSRGIEFIAGEDAKPLLPGRSTDCDRLQKIVGLCPAPEGVQQLEEVFARKVIA